MGIVPLKESNSANFSTSWFFESLPQVFHLLYLVPTPGGPAYYVFHPQKGITIWIFLTYQAFKSRGRNHFPKNSCWVIKDLGILDSQIHWLGYKAIVHTFCFLLLVSYFNEMVICFNIWLDVYNNSNWSCFKMHQAYF